MKQWEVLKTVFPEVITDNFEFVDYQETATTLEYWLDEREYMSRDDYKKGCVRPYGFTDSKTIQDFPIRGHSVYLHVRRRKWIDRSTGEIFSYTYDNLCEDGSKLSPEFVSFLKE
ncbi:MAG: transposase family protein [Parabacteroides sp.]|nr:transposase family protein [Parabacteroides sp.]